MDLLYPVSGILKGVFILSQGSWGGSSSCLRGPEGVHHPVSEVLRGFFILSQGSWRGSSSSFSPKKYVFCLCLGTVSSSSPDFRGLEGVLFQGYEGSSSCLRGHKGYSSCFMGHEGVFILSHGSWRGSSSWLQGPVWVFTLSQGSGRGLHPGSGVLKGLYPVSGVLKGS